MNETQRATIGNCGKHQSYNVGTGPTLDQPGPGINTATYEPTPDTECWRVLERWVRAHDKIPDDDGDIFPDWGEHDAAFAEAQAILRARERTG